MGVPGVIVINARIDRKNALYREYHVEEKLSLIPEKYFFLPITGIYKENLIGELGKTGADLLSMLNKIDGLDYIHLTASYVGISKVKGKDWRVIEPQVLIDLQHALNGTAYVVKVEKV